MQEMLSYLPLDIALKQNKIAKFMSLKLVISATSNLFSMFLSFIIINDCTIY